MSKSSIEIDGLWMRTKPGCEKEGTIEVLIRHEGVWKVAFGDDGPGPTAHDPEQLLDHCIHPLGLERIAAQAGLPPPTIDPADLRAHPRARARRRR